MNPKPKTENPTLMVNMLTIDVEDYFQVSAFESVSPPDTWAQRELRVERNTDRVLALLDEHGVWATFFVLGWVAERCPGLVRRIAAAGHEVASHGYGHRRVYTQTRGEFRDDVRTGKGLLEELTGEAVRGYRAPSYSISPATLWAFDELLEAGFTYDSSVFPVRHDLYGMPDWPRFPFSVERIDGGNWVPAEPAWPVSGSGESSVVSSESTHNPRPETQNPCPTPSASHESWVTGGGLEPSRLKTHNAELLASASSESTHNPQPTTRNSEPPARLLELPITTLRLLGRNLPIAGGGYFRLFPYAFTRWGLTRINRMERRPFVFYLHPWELDPDQPRIDGAGLKSRFRHYLNLDKTEGRFARLLDDFSFGPMRNLATDEMTTPGFVCRAACPSTGARA